MTPAPLVLSIAVLACAPVALGQTRAGQTPAWQSDPAIDPLPDWYEVRGGAWRVPAGTVAHMAAALDTEVAASSRARRDSYTMQYQGESSGAARSIRVMGGCDIVGIDKRTLSDHFRIVADGGTCFFDAIYDPDAKRFTSLRYHGNV